MHYRFSSRPECVRRQVVLGPFIVDFFAPSANLIVEVDGGIHHRAASLIALATKRSHHTDYACCGSKPSSLSATSPRPLTAYCAHSVS